MSQPESEPGPPPSPRFEFTAGFPAVLFFVAACGLLGWNLGHYTAWSDEADTVLFARGLLRTGELSARIDHNLYAYRNGMLLRDFRNRYTPPLPYYLAAGSMAAGGDSMFWARLPFALCGLALAGLLARWIARSSDDPRLAWVVAMALVGNVSLWLYCRQARYYGLVLLATTVAAYAWVHYRGRAGHFAVGLMAMLALVASQYLNYAALVAVLAVDWFVWRRHERQFTLREAATFFGPQLLIGVLLVTVFNPLGKDPIESIPGRNWLLDRATLFAWNLRDMSVCEYGVGILVGLAPLVGWWRGDTWLVRGTAALLVYTLAITVLSPQPVGISTQADVRYLAPVIPLTAWLGVRALWTVARRVQAAVLVPLAAVVFLSAVLHLPRIEDRRPSSLAWFLHELAVPRATATSELSRYFKDNLAPRATVWLAPEPGHFPPGPVYRFEPEPCHAETYPLMVHAPHVTYAWQLSPEPPPWMAGPPEIQAAGRVPVDVIVAVGAGPDAVAQKVFEAARKQGVYYRLSSRWTSAAPDRIRPELFWRDVQPRSRETIVTVYTLDLRPPSKASASSNRLPLAVRQGKELP